MSDYRCDCHGTMYCPAVEEARVRGERIHRDLQEKMRTRQISETSKRITVYKIRHKETGLFSSGGANVSEDGSGYGWSLRGKIWSSPAHIRSHLRMFRMWDHRTGAYVSTIPDSWEVIQFELFEQSRGTGIYGAEEFLKMGQMKKEKR